jgi:hypothetical protein
MNDLKVTDLLGLGSAGSFILTLLYLHGYSITLGVNLFLYFGLNDYFRLAIEWLPPIIGACIIGVLINKFFTRIERASTEEEIATGSPYPKFTRRFRHGGDIALLLVLLIPAVYYTVLSFFRYVELERLYGFWAAAGAVLWVVLMNWYVKEPKMVRNWTASWTTFMMFFPVLAICAFSYGLYAGKMETRLYTRLSDVHISAKDQATPMVGRILFLLDGHIVFRGQQAGSGIIVLPKTEVTKIVYSTVVICHAGTPVLPLAHAASSVKDKGVCDGLADCCPGSHSY